MTQTCTKGTSIGCAWQQRLLVCRQLVHLHEVVCRLVCLQRLQPCCITAGFVYPRQPVRHVTPVHRHVLLEAPWHTAWSWVTFALGALSMCNAAGRGGVSSASVADLGSAVPRGCTLHVVMPLFCAHTHASSCMHCQCRLHTGCKNVCRLQHKWWVQGQPQRQLQILGQRGTTDVTSIVPGSGSAVPPEMIRLEARV
jgi:hypothetical protein